MFCLLAQTSEPSVFQLLQRIDPDMLGAMGLVATILTFVLITIVMTTLCRTYQNISLAKLHNQMINELLAKGYSVDEIQQLVSGQRRSVLTRFFDGKRQTYVSSRPTAPVKPGAGV